jgi:hypothetical protein
MIEFRLLLQIHKQGNFVEYEDLCGNSTWFNIKKIIELDYFPCTKISFAGPDRTCNKCGMNGHSGKACIHSSQFLAFYMDDYLENKTDAKAIKLDDVIENKSILVLKRVPWKRAIDIYGKIELLEYSFERERMLKIKKAEMPKIIKRGYNEIPPNNYVCHTCGISGHWRQNCRENKKLKCE